MGYKFTRNTILNSSSHSDPLLRSIPFYETDATAGANLYRTLALLLEKIGGIEMRDIGNCITAILRLVSISRYGSLISRD